MCFEKDEMERVWHIYKSTEAVVQLVSCRNRNYRADHQIMESSSAFLSSSGKRLPWNLAHGETFTVVARTCHQSAIPVRCISTCRSSKTWLDPTKYWLNLHDTKGRRYRVRYRNDIKLLRTNEGYMGKVRNLKLPIIIIRQDGVAQIGLVWRMASRRSGIIAVR